MMNRSTSRKSILMPPTSTLAGADSHVVSADRPGQSTDSQVCMTGNIGSTATVVDLMVADVAATGRGVIFNTPASREGGSK